MRGGRYRYCVTDLATWLGVAVAVLALIVAYVSYRSGRNRVRLEYVLLARTGIIPGTVANSVELVHNGQAIAEPALTALRLVNTGDKAIPHVER